MTDTEREQPQTPTTLEQLDRCTVRLATDKSTGTGFFYWFKRSLEDQAHAPAIVTNNHVLEGATQLRLVVTGRKGDGPVEQLEITCPLTQLQIMRHPGGLDLCAIAIGPLLEPYGQAGYTLAVTFLNRSIVPTKEQLDELQAVNRVLMIGYPNGIWDRVNNKAIFRSGITATHPGLKYEGERNFLIDVAVFPGSSGSPVVLYENGVISSRDGWGLGGERLYLIGVVHRVFEHQTVKGELKLVDRPVDQAVVPSVYVPNNLGICLHADALHDIEALLFAPPVNRNPYGGYAINLAPPKR